MATIISKDALRSSIEAATGGLCTVLYDDAGHPGVMRRIPKFKIEDVYSDLGLTGTFPAFIVNGVEKSELFISVFPNVVVDNVGVSLPGLDPAVNMTFDQAVAYCANKGPGWHLMSNAEWAALQALALIDSDRGILTFSTICIKTCGMKSRSSSSTNVREYRRLRAVELFEGGMKAVRIAEVLGVTRAAVSQWLKRYREQGIDSLYHKPGPRRKGKLTDIQMNELTEMQLQGVENYGYTGDVRTGSRIRELIGIKFKMRLTVRHVQRLMKKLGWTPQKPVVYASRKNGEEVKLWYEQRWPDIKKAQDESGFYLLPFAGRTYAPKSQTPILHSPLAHYSVISGIGQDGSLHVQVQDRSFKGPDIVGFLRHLLCHVKQKILLIWDGCPIHRSKEVKKFLADENKGRIHIERLPPCSPELNPDEGVWQYLKGVLLKNVCCQDMKVLGQKLRKAIRILRRRRLFAGSFFTKCGYV